MTRKAILCVDDEETVLRSLKRELGEALGNDFFIETAEGGYDALDVFEELLGDQCEVPVIISDHIMLDMKGDELLRRIHEIAPKTLKIMLTGQADMEAVTNAVNQANLYRYIGKPWERTDLILTVKEAIHKYIQAQKLEEQNVILQNMNHLLEQQVRERTAELEAQKVELKQKNVQLKELNANKDKFFSIISHDLRAPFTTLLGFSQLLKANITQYSQEEIVHRADKIHASADRLHTLLENLLMWSQLQRGVMEYTPETIQLQPLAYETLELFRPHADQKKITLTLDVPQQLSAYADYSMINTVIRNLTSNALKFTAEQGEVLLMARGNGHTIEFHVTDTGVGIPEEHLPLLFRIDTQYTNPGTHGEQGTGLGLILCRELVEKNHGIIWVESEREKGTSFRFTLPCNPVT